MKISVLTLNPGIDRIIYLPTPTRLGTMNRASHTVVSQGSKGANIAIMLSTLGAKVDYFSFTGGESGQIAEKFVDLPGITPHYVKTASGVRTNTKIIDSDGLCTEFNERGGPVTKRELDELLSPLFDGNYDIVILSGSIPQPVENSVYNSIVSHFNKKSARCILDCDGDVMFSALKARPSLIKPNRRELAGILGVNEDSLGPESDVIAACRAVRERYSCDIACTLDKDGSIFCGSDGEYRVTSPEVTLAGFSGAGDTYLAAFIFKRYCEGQSLPEALAYASAAAAAKVSLPGTVLPGKEQILNMLARGITVMPV